ncbi:unnamed protein product, partial [Allacma fusca]
ESFMTEIIKELRFALQCQGDTKPVRKNKVPGEQSVSGSVPYLAFDQERREPSS